MIFQPMPSTPIRATDERVIPFPAQQIWSVLADVAESSRWWPSSVQLKVLGAAPSLVGIEMEICPRGGRPFRCRVEAIEPPKRMVMRYPGDFIVGTGEWRLEDLSASSTRVTYEIDVVANGGLAVILGRLLPLPKIHSKSMQDILAALEKETARRTGQGGRS